MLPDAWSAEQLALNHRQRRNLVLGLASAAVMLIVGSMTAVMFVAPQADPFKIILGGIVIIFVIATMIAVCYRPRLGLYILFAGALLFPMTHELGEPTMPTSYVPFWYNLSTIGYFEFGISAFAGLAISPAEILIVWTFLVWLVRGVSLREFEWRSGAFLTPILLYLAMVLVGFANGMANGGEPTMALYEIRSQVSFLLAYLLAVNLLTSRKHLLGILWLIVLCNGIQGVFGTITFAVKHANITEDGFMQHDESLILNLIFFVLLLAVMLKLKRRLIFAAVLCAPCALIAVLGNQRRAGIAAFIIALLPLFPILFTLLKDRRKEIGAFAFVFALASLIYLPLAWNSNGAWALPARAIRSQTDPNQRDAASNSYRAAEEYDLKVTRDVNQILGYGYGRKFIQKVALPTVSTDFVYYMPHNSILWVWMRLGNVGFFLFWIMVASFVVGGLELLKRVSLPEARLCGILAISMLLMTLTFGKYDLALVDTRVMSITATLLGILSMLPRYESGSRGDTAQASAAAATTNGPALIPGGGSPIAF